MIDEESSKIAFISSTERNGYRKVAKETPENKYEKDCFTRDLQKSILEIISIFKFNDVLLEEGKKLIKSLYKILVEKDADDEISHWYNKIKVLCLIKNELLMQYLEDKF